MAATNLLVSEMNDKKGQEMDVNLPIETNVGTAKKYVLGIVSRARFR